MPRQLETGTLWEKVVTTTQQAISDKCLYTIETQSRQIQQQGLNFTVRLANNIKRKRAEKKAQPEFNPFLPPESALTVCDISPSHLAVLNKFNVVDHHLLIITREYQTQQSLLDRADFSALCHCLAEYPSLGFYNAGEAAGASQKHKHLQLVPLPLYGAAEPFPFSPVFSSFSQLDGIRQIPQLPFRHAWTRLPEGLFDNPEQAAVQCHRIYREMLQGLNIKALPDGQNEIQSAPYNLLLTTQWMLLVPRLTEYCEGISVNAMGYVGSLFVIDQQGLEKLSEIGPLSLLQRVSL
ncbi:MAG: phosphorylase [Candidatus Thiodiazotropha taylori]|nr:phosphorylase [Candidatus Thiodiazotropha taylori]